MALLSNLESFIQPKKDISRKVKGQKTTLLEVEKAIEIEEKAKLPVLQNLDEASKKLQAEKQMVNGMHFHRLLVQTLLSQTLRKYLLNNWLPPISASASNSQYCLVQ